MARCRMGAGNNEERKTPMAKASMIAAAVVIAAMLGASAPVRADAVEDFYRGKTLRMLIGYGPAGGYDLYGRIVG